MRNLKRCFDTATVSPSPHPPVGREVDRIGRTIEDHELGQGLARSRVVPVVVGDLVPAVARSFPGAGEGGPERLGRERMVGMEGVALHVSLPVGPFPGPDHRVVPRCGTACCKHGRPGEDDEQDHPGHEAAVRVVPACTRLPGVIAGHGVPSRTMGQTLHPSISPKQKMNRSRMDFGSRSSGMGVQPKVL